MSSLLKTKVNRFLRLHLQNRGAEYVSFSQINQCGRVKGYVSGVVANAYPTFQHRLYGCLRKFTLSELQQDNDDDYIDDEPAQQLSFFTRGTVAEKCSNIRKGDIVVLEHPFVESINKACPVYHLAGDKTLSDLSVWVIRKNSASLIVSRTDERSSDSTVTNQDEPAEDVQDVDPLSEDVEVHLSNAEQQSPSILQGPSTSSKKKKKKKKKSQKIAADESVSEHQVTRSSSNSEETKASQTRSQEQTSSKYLSSQTEGIKRVTRSDAARSGQIRKSIDTFHDKASAEPCMTLRSSPKNRTHKDIPKQQNSDKSPLKSLSQSPTTRRSSRHLEKTTHESSSQEEATRSSSNKHSNSSNESDTDIFAKGAHVTKKQSKRKLFGRKGVSSTPKDNPDITNISMLESIEEVPQKKKSYPKDRSSDRMGQINQQKNTQGPSDNLRSHVQPFSNVSTNKTDEVSGSDSPSTSQLHTSNITTSSRGNKGRKIQSPQISSPKRILRSQAQAANTVSSDEDVITLNVDSENKYSTSPTIPIQNQILQPQVTTQLQQVEVDDGEIILNFNGKGKKNQAQSPKAVFPQRVLRSHLASSSADAEKIQPRYEGDSEDSPKVVRSPAKGHARGNADVEATNGNNNSDSAKMSCPSTPSGIFNPTRDKESDANSANVQTPKPVSPGKRLRSPAKSANVVPVDDVAASEQDDADSQTSSQQTTPSGTFLSKKRRLTRSTKRNSSDFGKDKVQQQPNNADQSSTKEQATKGLQSPQDNNAPCTTATHDDPSNQSTQNAQGTSDTHNAPGTSTTNNVPVTVTTQDSSASTQNASDPSDGNQSAFRVSYTVPRFYTKLSGLQLGTITNLYGVVKYFKPPWKSRGTDMCSVVVIADPSSDDTLECVMFNKDANLLPQVRRIGDIVRLHRMKIKRYKDKFQALSTKGFSAIVFDRNVTIPVSQDVARFHTATFSFENNEKAVVKTLKEWRVSLPDLFEPAKVITVSELEPDMYFDIICQVKGVYKQKNLDCICLKVTDGTDPRYEIKSCDGDELFEQTVAFDPNQGHFTTFDIYLYGDHAMLLLSLKVANGDILFLHNVHSSAMQVGSGTGLLDVIETTVELCMHRGSDNGRGVAVLRQDSDDAKDLQQRLDNIL